MENGSKTREVMMGIWKYFKSVKTEVQSKGFWRGVRCELLGTLLYVLFGCGGSILHNHPKEEINFYSFETKSALSFGLIEIVLIYTFGTGSACHFNPAVTIGMLCSRYITCVKATCYICVQVIGATIGAAIIYGLIPGSFHETMGVTLLSKDVSRGQGFGFEFLATFMFVFCYFCTMDVDKLSPHPIPCGAVICLTQIFAVSIQYFHQ